MKYSTLALIPLISLGCSVTSKSGDSGGLGGQSNEATCAGTAVLLSDYMSTQIALSDGEGKTLTESLISTASTATDGLAFPLSGDVALASTKAPSGELVVIDRYGTNVITWINVESGKVRAQLPVGTGFESNPQDYVEIGNGLAAVSRRETNFTPGAEDFDDGGDILLIDTKTPKILDNVLLPSIDNYPPNPSALSYIDGDLFVTLERVAADWSSTATAMIVPVDTKAKNALEPVTLTGLKGCGGLVPTPDGKELAVACTGAIDSDGEVEGLNQSALVFFDRSARPLQETRRIAAKDIAEEPIQSQFAFASNSLVLVKTQTTFGGDKNNRLLGYDLKTKKRTVLTEALPGKDGLGQGLTIGTIQCHLDCSDICLVPNASTAQLERVNVAGDAPKLLSPVTVEDKVKLPPRGLGEY